MLTPCIPSVNVPGSQGYAMRYINGKRVYEHVAAWEAVHGPVPPGRVLDHICHEPSQCAEPGPQCSHRRCRNPEHLTPVTRGDNARRAYRPQAAKTQCPHGHDYSEENTYVDPRGRRHCRTCTRKYIRENKRRRRARLS